MMDSEYQDFLKSGGRAPPRLLSETLLESVRRDLKPSAWLVFPKLAGLHLLTAILTLSLCPQLGFRLGGEGMGLMDYFMGLGPHFCMSACGFFFLGSSLLVASLVLRPEELRVIRERRWGEIGSLAILSLGFFMAMNPETLLSIALMWLLGSVSGAVVSLELGWWLRRMPLPSAERR